MYPTNLYGNPQRQYQLFGRDGFLRNIPAPMPTGRILDSHAQAFNLRATLNSVRNFLIPMLPDDCPVVLGGGFVRDGLLGGAISDIDVWLPSNITCTPRSLHTGELHAADMCTEIRLRLNGDAPNPLFEAPFAALGPNDDGTAYHDMSNHWVVGTYVNDYPVQFMRTNVPWENDPQQFMTGIMRNFDIDLCMMFLCFQTDHASRSSSVDELLSSEYIVMPDHLLEDIQSGSIIDMMWNTARDTTSEARRLSRLNKMMNKYEVDRVSQAIDFGRILPEEINAVPVRLSTLMDLMHHLPLPRVGNGRVQDGTTGAILQAQGQVATGDPVRQPNGTGPAPAIPPAPAPYTEGTIYGPAQVPAGLSAHRNPGAYAGYEDPIDLLD